MFWCSIRCASPEKRTVDPRNQLNVLVINMLRVTGATKKHPAKQRGKQIPGPYLGCDGTAAGMNALRRLGAAGSSPQGLSSRPAIGTSVPVPFISGCPENSWNQKYFVVTHNVLNISRIVIRGVPILTPPQVFILLNFRGLHVT